MRPAGRLAPIVAIAGLSLRESIRRRVFLVVAVLTVAFLALYALGAHFAFQDTVGFAGSDPEILDVHAFTGATVFGLAMFAILFLGAVVAVFLTLGVIRGEAESGLLQPLVVRPVGRRAMLLARFGAAAGATALYVLIVYLAAVLITGIAGGWWPDHLLIPGLCLAGGVIAIAAISIAASAVLSSTAQGIAVLMVFGAGLTAGLLGEIGEGLNNDTLKSIADVASWALPFEALYRGGLHALVSDTSGLTGVAIQLGPFGGSRGAGPGLVLWWAVYVTATIALAMALFSRRDL